MDLRYSAGVVAPMHWISPRERAGFKMFAASREPSADPAPTSVCNSSMKMMAFCASINSFIMVLRRSSNCPRYLVPATISERSSARMRLSARKDGTLPSAMRWARPSTMAVFPPDQRIQLTFQRRLGEVTTEFRKQGCFLGTIGGHFFALGPVQFFAQGG